MSSVGALSFSGIKTFETCPHKFYRLKVAKDVKEDFSHPAAQWGNEVHKALEHYLTAKRPLGERFKAYQEYASRLDQIEGDRFVELRLAITDDGEVCSFFDRQAAHRGVLDYLVIRDDKKEAILIDHKTGKVRPTKQLHYNALMVFAAFPRVQILKAAFYWLPADTYTKHTFHRSEIDDIWDEFEKPLVGIEECAESGEWPRKQSPLCGWCPVYDCPFNTAR